MVVADATRSVAPIETPCQGEHRQPRALGNPAGVTLRSLKKRKLLAEEQILGDERGAGAKKQRDEGEQLSNLSKVDYR